MKSLYHGVFDGLTVLLTGHTGFKGSWLTLWLKQMGANVVGYSLPEPPTTPSNFELAGIGQTMSDVRGDIRDYEALRKVIAEHQPELVIHFAAQTTVLPSYEQPKLSLDTNVGGTINVLEAVRTAGSVRALIVCATDKVYENKEWIWGYRENDELGGYDPYSTGKAMAELAVNSYRRSFFTAESNSLQRQTAVGSVRAGNVIGGGDFTENGLLADSMRAILNNESIYLRNPSSTRPWQYVLEPLSGYLRLAEKLLTDGQEFAEAWNFGPLQHSAITTLEVVQKLVDLWDGDRTRVEYDPVQAKRHEANSLHLNWDKSASRLQWRPVFTIDDALAQTVNWYRAYQGGEAILDTCQTLLQKYVDQAQHLNLAWACD